MLVYRLTHGTQDQKHKHILERTKSNSYVKLDNTSCGIVCNEQPQSMYTFAAVCFELASSVER